MLRSSDRHSPRRRASRQQRGVTLVETTVALLLFAIGSVAVLGTMNYALALDVTNRETTLAMDAARNKVAEISTESFDRIVLLYDADVTNDPDGSNTAPGDTFNVAGLTQIPGVANGSVELPINGSAEVVETLSLADLGLPRDLNGDGATSSGAVELTEDLLVMPVLVRIRWRGSNGDREVVYRTVVRR